VLARGHLLFERHDQALAELDRAIEINPSDGVTLAARGNILTWLGHADAAIEALEHGQRVDPHLNAMDRFSLSLAYYLASRFEDAATQAAVSLRQNPDSHFSLVILAAANAQIGRTEDAASAVAAIRQQYPTFDAREFGSKLRRTADLELLRNGLRRAGLYPD
jgi:adenylate cyclase